jgi:hypothetical protein
MTELYFHDTYRAAAEHLLDSPFGVRLRQIAKVETSESHGYLAITSDGDLSDWLSGGECVLLDVLASLAGRGQVSLTDLTYLDDRYWDRVVAALFIARGRVLTGVAA